MSVMYILLPLALFFSALAVGLFVWATHNGQFDDMDTPSMRMLQDDDIRSVQRQKAHTESN